MSDAASFFGDAWPEARAVVDPDLELYRAFGLHRGSIWQLMNPGVVACSLRAASKGHVQGRTVGDALQMPGLFFVQGESILWQKDYAHAGDSPDWEALPARLAALQPLPE